jgi:hypothetical protein
VDGGKLQENRSWILRRIRGSHNSAVDNLYFLGSDAKLTGKYLSASQLDVTSKKSGNLNFILIKIQGKQQPAFSTQNFKSISYIQVIQK